MPPRCRQMQCRTSVIVFHFRTRPETWTPLQKKFVTKHPIAVTRTAKSNAKADTPSTKLSAKAVDFAARFEQYRAALGR
eukprot:1013491-Rhodomonas_salina.1